MKNNFKNLSVSELAEKKDELSSRLRDVRFNIILGHVENPLEKRTLRRSIARINTLLHEKKGLVKD